MAQPAPPRTLAEVELENQRLRRAVEELSILNSIGAAIGSTMDLAEVVDLIIRECVKHLDIEQATVLLLDPGRPEDALRTMARRAPTGADATPYRLGRLLAGWMLKHRKPLLVNDLSADERFKVGAAGDDRLRSVLSVPLRVKGEMVGLLNAFNKRGPDGFTEDDQRLLSIIASQSSQIVENARLYEELRRRTRELTESEAKYRALMQSASEAIVLVDTETHRVVEVNDQAARISGIPREQLLGMSLCELMPISELRDPARIRDVAAGENLRLSFSLEDRDGSGRRYYDLAAAVVRFDGRQVIQIICLDVTEREKLELHLKDHAAELEREVERQTRILRESQFKLIQQEKMAALGKLVAGIAHEMNTPIGTINSNADTLARSLAVIRESVAGPDAPEAFRENRKLNQALSLLEDIARVNRLACERIVGIVGSLRGFARLDEADLQIADLHRGLDNTLTLIQHELKNRVRVVKQYGDVPPVRCHPNQINQVFMNLLVNAAQSIPDKGEIRVRTYREDKMVHVEIADSGIGIPPADLPRIFDPGFTTKGVGVGTGLGLSICFKIAEEHGGSIDVKSAVGEGSTFTLRLPINPAPDGKPGR